MEIYFNTSNPKSWFKAAAIKAEAAAKKHKTAFNQFNQSLHDLSLAKKSADDPFAKKQPGENGEAYLTVIQVGVIKDERKEIRDDILRSLEIPKRNAEIYQQALLEKQTFDDEMNELHHSFNSLNVDLSFSIIDRKIDEFYREHVEVSDAIDMARNRLEERRLSEENVMADIHIELVSCQQIFNAHFNTLKDKKELTQQDVDRLVEIKETDCLKKMKACRMQIAICKDIQNEIKNSIDVLGEACNMPDECRKIVAVDYINIETDKLPLSMEKMDDLHRLYDRCLDDIDDRQRELDNIGDTVDKHKEKIPDALQKHIKNTISVSKQILLDKSNSVKKNRCDDYAILHCHAVICSLMNFDYWETKQRTFGNDTILDDKKNARTLPVGIVALLKMAKDAQFENWQEDPEQARKLIIAIRNYARKYATRLSADVREFYQSILSIKCPTSSQNWNAYCHNDHRNEPERSRGILPIKLHDYIRANEATHLTLGNLQQINTHPGFFTRYPILKKVLKGIGIGLAITAAIIIIGGIIYATGPAGGMAVASAAFAKGGILIAAKTFLSSFWSTAVTQLGIGLAGTIATISAPPVLSTIASFGFAIKKHMRQLKELRFQSSVKPPEPEKVAIAPRRPSVVIQEQQEQKRAPVANANKDASYTSERKIMQNVVNWLNETEIAPPEDLEIINRLLTNMVAFESKPGIYDNKLFSFYTESKNNSSHIDVYLRYKDLYEKEMYHLRYKDMYENRNPMRP